MVVLASAVTLLALTASTSGALAQPASHGGGGGGGPKTQHLRSAAHRRSGQAAPPGESCRLPSMLHGPATEGWWRQRGVLDARLPSSG
jgi:hypothetical protein